MFPAVPRVVVPEMLASFDICLLPQLRTDFNLAASPRKLAEYLGSMRAVVTLNCPEADLYAPCVESTYSREAFVEAAVRLADHGLDKQLRHLRNELIRGLTSTVVANKLASTLRKIS
jgi:hypothetical protein